MTSAGRMSSVQALDKKILWVQVLDAKWPSEERS